MFENILKHNRDPDNLKFRVEGEDGTVKNVNEKFNIPQSLGATANSTRKQSGPSGLGSFIEKMNFNIRGLGNKNTTSPKITQVPRYNKNDTRAKRNNNPLNIKFSPYTANYQGVVGLDKSEADDGGQFLIFKTFEDGLNGAKRLLQTEGYVGLSVDQAMKRWSNNGYGGEIIPHLKNKIIGQLTDSELGALINSIAKHEDHTYNPQGTSAAVPGKKTLGVVTTMPGTPTKYEQSHPGIDIANKIGTPIPAFTNGIVVAIEQGRKQGEKGYGNYVIVKDKDGNQHRYSHMDKGYVKIGDSVKKGQVLGTMGNTGSTYSESGGSGAHLDYRIASAYGKYLNPLTYVKNMG